MPEFLRPSKRLIFPVVFAVSAFFSFHIANATSVTAATGGGTLCLGANYTTLTDIIITEQVAGDFSNTGLGRTLTVSPSSANFQFNIAVLPGVSVTGTGISVTTITFISPTQLQITINLLGSSTGAFNSITISGLEIQAITAATLGATLTHGGTLNINTAASFGSLNSYSPPTPSIGGLTSVCEDQVGVNYTTASVVGHTYSWTVTGGLITAGGATHTATVTWGSSGAGSVTVTETNAQGCPTTTAPYAVTINPNPTPVITGPNSVCANAIGAVYSTPAVGGHTYVWVVTGGAVTGGAGTNSITVTWGAAGAGTVKVTETITATTCAVTTPTYSVTINSNPAPIITGPSSVCAGQAAVGYSTPGIGGNTYVWTITGGTITGGGNTAAATVTWGTAGPGSISVTETTTASGCSKTATIALVTINAVPAPVVSGLNSVCAGSVIGYSTPPTGNTFVWTVVGGAVTGGAGTNSISVTWAGAGPGTVKVTETNATPCSTTTPNFNVTINSNPAPIITGPSSVCAGQAAVGYSTPGIGGNTYVWTITGGTITGGGNTAAATVTWGTAGPGSISVTETTTASGCSKTATIALVTINAVPAPVVSGLNSVCAGSVIGYSTPPTGNTFVWTVVGGAVTGGAGTNSISVTWAGAGPGTVKVTETNATPCSTTTPNFNVTINSNPAPIITGPSSVCAGQAAVGYSTPSIGGNTYVWTITGGTITGGGNTAAATVTWGTAGPGSISVTETTTASGCSKTATIALVTINAVPAPVVSGLNSVCAGSVIGYSTPPTGNTFVWTVVGGAVTGGAGTNSISVTWAGAGPGTVKVTETNATPCSTTTPNFNVTINSNPAPIITGPSSVCAGQAAVGYSTPGIGGNTYVWTITGGTITGGGNTAAATVTWGTAGPGSISVTETTTASGCSKTATIALVTINAVPAPVVSGLNSVCAGSVIGYSTPPTGNTFVWTVVGGAVTGGAGTNSISVTWAGAGPGTVKVTETNATPCSTTTPNFNVTINSNPAPIITGPSSVCAGQAAVGYSTPSIGGNTYVWTITGGTITGGGNTAAATVTWGTAGPGSISVTETTTASGCSKTATIALVTINAVPAPVVSGLNSVCAGSVIGYSTPPTGNTFVWTVVGGAVTGGAGTNSISVTWAGAGPGTVKVTETNATPCSTTTPNFNVTINSNPAPIITGPSSVCAGQAAVGYSTPGIGGNTYVWTITGGTITGGGNTAAATVTWGTAGPGSISVTETTTASGCSKTATIALVTINAVPAPVVSGLNSVCAGSVIGYSTPPTGNTFVWTVVGGAVTGGAGTNSISVTWAGAGPGTVKVTETNATPCSTTTPNFNVTINSNPAPIITGPSSVCAGQAAVGYSTPGIGGNTYVWTITGGTITGGGNTAAATVTWGTAGPGSISVTETTTASGCSKTATIALVTINAVPAPVVSGLNSVCAGSVIGYSTPATGNTFVWTVVGGAVTGGAGTNSISVTWAGAGPGTVKVTETNATPCSTTTPNFNVTINSNPAPIITGPSSVCAGQAAVGYSTPSIGGNTYVWTITGGTITGGGNTAAATVTWGTAGTGSISVTETTTASGCSKTATIALVTINAVPAPVVSGLNSVCANSVIAYSTPSIVGDSYAWTVIGGGVTGGAGTNSITVTWAGAGPGTVKVTETNAALCATTTSNFNVTINANPTPSIGGLDPVCAQSAEVYSTTNVGGDTYLWTITGGTISAGAGTSAVTVVWGSNPSGSLSVIEKTPAGCSVTDNMLISIQPLPTPVITGLNSVCESSTTTYSTTNVGGDTYSWTVVGGTLVSGDGTNAIIVTWSGPGTGQVQVTETNGSTFCSTTTLLYNVTINANPTPSITGPSAVCAGQAAVGYTTPNVGGNTYVWTITGGTITAGVNSHAATATWGGAGTGNISVTETTPSGCTQTFTIPTVTINAVPAPVISGLNAVCAGTVTNYSTPLVVGDSYVWTVTGGSVTGGAGSHAITVTWSGAGPGTVAVTETNATPCSTTTSNFNVTINANPTPAAIGLLSVCAGQAAVGYSTGNVGGDTYIWTISGGTITAGGNSSAATVTWGASGPGSISVTETTPAGCSKTSTIPTVTINPVPAPVVSGLNSVCAGSVIGYSTPSIVGDTYVWTVTGGAVTGGAGTNSITVTWAAAGSGTVSVKETNATPCSTTTINFNVTINSNPAPVITGSSSVCEGQVAVTYSTTNVALDTYVWTISGGTITGGVNTSIATVTWGAAGTGTISVTETTPQGCSKTATNSSVVINPVPTFSITNNTPSICSPSQVDITLNSPTPGATMTLQNVAYGAVTGGLYALGGTFATGGHITESLGGLINPTSAPITVTYLFSAATASCSNVTAQQTTVVVNPPPAMAITNSTSAICSGSPVNILLTTPTSGGLIKLNSVNYGLATGTLTAPINYSNNSVITETLTNTTNNSVIVVYSFSVSANGCNTAGPFITTVTVNAIPTTTAAPLNSSICSGSATSIALTNTNSVVGGVTFNWTASVLSGTVSGQAGGSGTTIGQTLTTDNVGGTVRYSIQATSTSGTCLGPATISDVIVNPVPAVTVNAASTNAMCSGALTNIVIQDPNNVSGAAFNWTVAVTAGSVSGQASGTGSLIAQVLTTTPTGGTVRYTITPVTPNCTGVSTTWDVVVNPVPVWSNEVEPAVCSNSPFSFAPALGNGVATSFAWNASYDVGLTGGAASGAGPVTGTLTNITSGTLNATFTIIPTATGPGTCVGPSFTILVPVNPKPVGNSVSLAAVCSDVAFSHDPQTEIGNGVSSTFVWNAVFDPGLTGGTAAGTGLLTGTITNDTGLPLNATFTITPKSAAGCSGANFQVIQPISSKPKGTPAAAAPICSGQQVNYNLQLNVTGTNGMPSNFSWIAASNGNVGGESTTLQSGPFITDILTNTTGSDQTVNYTITPTSLAGCVGVSFGISVLIHSQPVGTNSTQTATCSGTLFSFDPQSYTSMPSSFSWSASYAVGLTGGAGMGTGLVAETLINSQSTVLNATYTLIATAAGCPGTSFTMIVPVNPQPTGVAQALTRCSKDAVNTTLTTTGGSPVASTFTISISSGSLIPVSGINSGPGLLSSELVDDVWRNTGSLPVNAVYTITPFTGSCAGAPFTVVVTYNPEPVGVADAVSQCSDIAINYDLLTNVSLMGNNVGSTFTWVAAPNGFVTGQSLTPQSGPVIKDAVNNISSSDQIVSYTVTPTAVTGCVGNTFQIDVTIHPEPRGNSTAAPKICSGSPVNYDLQLNVNGVNSVASSFTWKAAANANVSGASTSLQSTSVINDVLVNLTFVPQMVTYTIIPTSVGGCLGDLFTITETINPKAVVSAGPDLASCANIPNPQLQGVITFAPAGVQWSSSSSGTGAFAPGNIATPNYNYVPADVTTPPTLTITANDPDGPSPAGPCLAESDVMILKVNPLPNVVFFGLPASAAENDAIIPLSANQAGGLFTISPGSGLGTTFVGTGNVDQVVFDPSAATLGLNIVTYAFTDANSCSNSTVQNIYINPVTTISFHVDGASVNGSNQQEFCANQSQVHITTSHGPTAGLLPYTRLYAVPAYAGQTPPVGMVFTDGSTESDGSLQYFVQTDGLPSDLYAIEYDYENSAFAKTQLVIFVRIFAAPTAIMNVPSNCISSAINFQDISTLPSTTLPHAPPAPVIDRWEWDFKDGTSVVTIQNPSHLFTAPGVYNVNFKVTTNSPQNCSNTEVRSVRVGSLPAVDFSWSAICNNDSTKFQDLTQLAFPSTIQSYTWDFGDTHSVSGPNNDPIPPGTDAGFTSGHYKTPAHKYANFQNYTAKLTVQTNDGCFSTIAKNLFTLAYTTVKPVPTAAYMETFEGSQGGWQVEAIVNPADPISWQWGAPSGSVINSGSGSAKAWWTGGHVPAAPDLTTYYVNEQTVVNGPCFDISSLDRPMFSMDYWVDTQTDFDGAVLQYSVDGGNNWRNIGVPGEGINWYTKDQIVSNPGLQGLGQYGWTGQSGKWLNARANLDTIPGARTQVRVRIAFGSDATTPPGLSFDGFAFDNVFVGEKRRTVIVEHFTNYTLNASVNADKYLDNLYNNAIALRGVSDFNDVRYHVSYPSSDSLYTDNPKDVSSRSLFMGVTQPPFSIMDGLLDPSPGSKFTGILGAGGIDKVEIDRRALVDPLFDLTLQATPGTAPNKINVQLDMKALQAFNSPLVIQVVLIDQSTGASKNVLRKQLFGNDGITVNQGWAISQTLSTVKTDVIIDVPIFNSNALTMIAYVQDKNTREIYQSNAIRSPQVPAVKGSTITGIIEPFPTVNADEITIFPNPANGYFRFGLPSEFPQEYNWKIADQRSLVVAGGDFSQAANGQLQVNVADLPGGMYFVIIGAPGKPSIYRKLVIVNGN